jgi:hypothetical protein
MQKKITITKWTAVLHCQYGFEHHRPQLSTVTNLDGKQKTPVSRPKNLDPTCKLTSEYLTNTPDLLVNFPFAVVLTA